MSWSRTPPTILDVRDEEEYQRGHIEGSTCNPEVNTTALMHKVQEADPVVLVCKDGRLSAMVARMMGVCGFPGVAYLRGGIDAWKLAGKPVMETTRSGTERQAHETHDPLHSGPVSKVFGHFSFRVLIAGLVLSAALLTLLALAFAD